MNATNATVVVSIVVVVGFWLFDSFGGGKRGSL